MTTITALVWRPGQSPKVEKIETSLEALQELVGGDIEGITLSEDFYLHCNDEGRLIPLPYCCTSKVCGRLLGTVVITRIKDDEPASIQPKDVRRILDLFVNPVA